MSTGTEQLIRDYLNRLSVAARGQLTADDRRALVSRTREFIDQRAGFPRRLTTVEVGQLLRGLGDPAGLVRQERERLAAVRGDSAPAGPRPAGAAEDAAPPGESSRGWVGRVLRGNQNKGSTRGSSWHWPVLEGNRSDLQARLLSGEPATNGAGSGASTAARPADGRKSSGAGRRPAAGGTRPAGGGQRPGGGQRSATGGQRPAAGQRPSGSSQRSAGGGSRSAGAERPADGRRSAGAEPRPAGGNWPGPGPDTPPAAPAAAPGSADIGPETVDKAKDPASAGGATGPASAGGATDPSSAGTRPGPAEAGPVPQPRAGPDGPGPAPDETAAVSNSPVTVYANRSPADATDGTPGGEPAPTRAFPASTASGTDAPNPPWWTPAGQSARRAGQAAAGGRADEDRASAGASAPATLAAAASGLRTAIVRVAGWCRRHPVEAVAVLLLGVGGVVFPPVWLAGALVALASRRWDSTDKWVALALPVLLTVLGLVVGVTMSGHNGISHEIHQGWAYADVISRLTALLSAVYLVWRSTRARRVPPQPPWNRLRDGG